MVEYDLSDRPEAGEGVWRWARFLPRVGEERRLSLGEGRTPLARVPELTRLTGCERLLLKMESQNPTAAHKDRFHAVSTAVGRELGYRGVFAISTGNHGLSMSCYAAAHGMKAVVIGNPRMPPLLQRAIRFAGGLPLMAPWEAAEALFATLIERGDWFPSTTSWPMPFADPFGIEGYKTIAYEVYEALGDRMPDAFFVPTAGGDGLTGVWRGVLDLRRDRRAHTECAMVPCQPAGASPLLNALDQGLDEVPYLEGAHSLALSIADPITGAMALETVRASGGFGVRVTDEAILAMGRLLARSGLIVEPSSAASVAGAVQAIAERPELREATIVCVITSSGLKWLEHYEEAAPLGTGLRVERVEEALAAIAAFAG